MITPGHAIQLVMVTYHRPNDLKLSLESILSNTAEPINLTIIDNSGGGLDAPLAAIDDQRVTIHKNMENLGKGRAFMRYYREIMRNKPNDFFVSIDPDLVVPTNWLTDLLRLAYQLDNPGIIAPTIIQDETDDFTKQLSRNSLVMHRHDHNSKFIRPGLYQNRHTAGPLFLISRLFFEKVGGYVQTQLYGNDDGELCKAAVKQRRFVGIATEIKVRHLENDVTPGYRAWKARNVNKNTDSTGYWG